MDDAIVRLTFPAKADYLLLPRLALAGLARAAPLDPELEADLKLAVTEACGNVVRHAYTDGEGIVTVALHVTENELEMVVEDQGIGIEAPTAEEIVSERAREGGMGMAIIRAIVDELEIGPGTDGRGTVVHMTKHLVSEPRSPASEQG